MPVVCWAPQCSHSSVGNQKCRFFTFPVDPKKYKKWLQLLRRVGEPRPHSKVCVCHFPDGNKNNDPQIFAHNAHKWFGKNYLDPEKARTRRSRKSMESDKSNVVVAKSMKTYGGKKLAPQKITVKPSTTSTPPNDTPIKKVPLKKDAKLIVTKRFVPLLNNKVYINNKMFHLIRVPNTAKNKDKVKDSMLVISTEDLASNKYGQFFYEHEKYTFLLKEGKNDLLDFGPIKLGSELLIERKVVENPKPLNDLIEDYEKSTNFVPDLFDENNLLSGNDHYQDFPSLVNVCPYCGQVFELLSKLIEHKNQTHGRQAPDDTEPTIMCKQCGKFFETKNALKLHTETEVCLGTVENMIQKNDDDAGSKSVCSYCNEIFDYTTDLILHKKEKHSKRKHDDAEKMVKVPCPSCGNEYAKKNLASHMNTVHVRESHLCEICGNRFKMLKSLQMHMLVHENRREFTCVACDKSFNTPTILQSHIKMVHANPKEWKYSCPICDKRFSLKTNMMLHMDVHIKEKNYICEDCPKAFKSELALKKHKKNFCKREYNVPERKLT